MTNSYEMLVEAKLNIYREYLKSLDRECLILEWYDRFDVGLVADRIDFEKLTDAKMVERLEDIMTDILFENPKYEHIITWRYLHNSY